MAAAPRRSLGGGRVLGSGKSLVPPSTTSPTSSSGPPPPPPPKQLQAVRSPGLLSPSESSVSLSSQTSSTPISTENEDLTSRIALDEHASVHTAATAASSRMVCPICNEEMVTLLQLNRHIDDNHANLEEIEQDEAKTWFKQQMKRAKKFQPLALINQKLRGLEAFESNNETTHPAQASAPAPAGRDASPAPSSKEPAPPDPDEVVTRTHWQRPRGYDDCSDPMCGKRLGAANGQVNCRHCGKLFCEEHTMYEMKLSRSAHHEPVRGLWCRVCETCYKSRQGYNDHRGSERDHFDFFGNVRRKTVNKQYLETSRLETRLTRLTQLLADPPPDENQSTSTSFWSSIAGNKSHMRSLEQSVVAWEDDAGAAECPYCQQPFSQYSLRRHHCRICGRVVCGDPTTGCSNEVGLDVDNKKNGAKVPVEVRMCRDCQRTIFSKSDFARELAAISPAQYAYSNLVQFEHGIRLLLPKFQRLLAALQDVKNPPSPAQLAEASKVRKKLMDAFTQYDIASRRIRDMPVSNPTQEQLQKAIYQKALNFLHVHMLPLKSLPKILKHVGPNALHAVPITANGKPTGALAAIKYNDLTNEGSRPASSRTSSTSSAAITALEVEEKQFRERLMILEEQKFFVSEMIANANKRRKFDEVSALSQNMEDLSTEIDQIQGQLAQMDFAGAYAADQGIIK